MTRRSPSAFEIRFLEAPMEAVSRTGPIPEDVTNQIMAFCANELAFEPFKLGKSMEAEPRYAKLRACLRKDFMVAWYPDRDQQTVYIVAVVEV